MAEIFLSEPWITEARALYESWADRLPPVAHSVVVNLLVNEAPFEPGEVTAHLDTSAGGLVIDHGHRDGADLFVVVDYATARAIPALCLTSPLIQLGPSSLRATPRLPCRRSSPTRFGSKVTSRS